jgi:hypothetical protein
VIRDEAPPVHEIYRRENGWHLIELTLDQCVHGHVAEAVAHYFRYQEQATRLTVRNTLRLGRASLAVGLRFLAACVAGAQPIFTHDNVLHDARMYARSAQMPVELRQRR